MILLRYISFFIKLKKNSYFLYGLQAATSLRFVFIVSGWPSIVPSHIISFIHPTADVVFASSKKRTVMMWSPYSLQLYSARDSACLTFSTMCFLVVPPWTCQNVVKQNNLKWTWYFLLKLMHHKSPPLTTEITFMK